MGGIIAGKLEGGLGDGVGIWNTKPAQPTSFFGMDPDPDQPPAISVYLDV